MKGHPGRWYAARNNPPGAPGAVRLAGQPRMGFADVGEVMAWLEERGAITRAEVDGEPTFTGWGDPYCAVLGSRGDPWELA